MMHGRKMCLLGDNFFVCCSCRCCCCSSNARVLWVMMLKVATSSWYEAGWLDLLLPVQKALKWHLKAVW